MPLYMDEHNLGTVDASDVAGAHTKDLEVQEKYGVKYQRYWVDESGGNIYCQVEAPNAEAAVMVHREAHGLVAESIREVVEGS